jgi:hypothetical protein
MLVAVSQSRVNASVMIIKAVGVLDLTAVEDFMESA